MVCQACNAAISPEVRFCSRCGAPSISSNVQQQQSPAPVSPTTYVPQYAPRPRVIRNLQTLGVLWCVFGAYRLVTGLVAMFFLHAISMNAFGGQGWPFNNQPPFPQSWMSVLVPVLAAVTLVSAALAFVTGYGLLGRRRWGRILGIVSAILAVLKFPLGTALGIYTLWVLAPSQSGFEYNTMVGD